MKNLGMSEVIRIFAPDNIVNQTRHLRRGMSTLHFSCARSFVRKPVKLTVFFLIACFVGVSSVKAQSDVAVEQLLALGFENVRCSEDSSEVVYTIESNVYKIQAVGAARAIEKIQSEGLVEGKKCTVIMTDNGIPLIALTYRPDNDRVDAVGAESWNITTRDFGESWKKVKKSKKRNSSFLNVDVVVYPQFYYKNIIINQIYQILLEVSPAIEVTLWSGAKLTAQMIWPAYNDGFTGEYENTRPGYITLQQQFRLPYNITGDVRLGVFDLRTYGGELNLKYFFKDEHFSLSGKLGCVGVGYYKDFGKFTYNGDQKWYWSVGPDYYWARYNVQFKLRAEQYLMQEIGIKGEMIRHFRYCSIGLYAEKAQHSKSNGGFRIYVSLPPYKYKRYKKFPRITTGLSTGTTYNGGNERNRYLMPASTADDNLLKQNQFNPFFIRSTMTQIHKENINSE